MLFFHHPKSIKLGLLIHLSAIGISSAGGFVKSEKGQSFHFGETDFNHPIFENIFMDEKKKQVESPEIYSYIRINPGGKGKSDNKTRR